MTSFPGLKYEDILIETPVVKTAVEWLPKQEATKRTRRLVRAMDCSLKRTELPKDLQAVQKPFDFYLRGHVNEVEALHYERKELMGKF